MLEFVMDELIFMVVAGSRMYGTSTPESDVDKRGVCVPPKKVVLGFARNFDQQEVDGEDTVIFALRKFLKLAVENNPNIIELMFAPDDCIETCHPTWERLLARRDEFVSAKAYHTFSGYAFSQLKRIRTHRAWLLNPPTHQPTRGEFGLAETGAGVREIARGVDASKISPAVLRVIEREKRYKAALTHWTQYQWWRKNRNPARAALEEKHGYDTKHAGHLLRLLRMGEEILTTGLVIVRRPDAEELLGVRRGALSYDELMEEVEARQAHLERIYEEKTYVVPFSSDKAALSDLCVELHEFHWSRQ